MENTPFGSGPYEAPDSGAEKPNKETKKKKKKSAGAEAPKPKHNEDIARSVSKLPLFERDDKQAAKTEAAHESSDKPLDQLSGEEQQHVVQETARNHLAAIEQADEETAEQLEPAAEFLQRVADGQNVEEAYQETVIGAGLIEEAINAGNESEPVAEAPEIVVIDTSEDSEGTVGWQRGASDSEASSGRRTASVTPPARLTHPAAAAVTPAIMPARANLYYQDQNKAGELLLIGMVGYLIGRRRGRVRAEKRLLPVQRKLEKQVKQLEQDITNKEQKLVAMKAEKQRNEARPVVAPVERTQPGLTETRIGMEKPVRAERLGHMVVAAEAPRRTAEIPKNLSKAVNAETVPDMSRNELLEVSEKIVVEGASLRRIYESRLIGEKQLRHLVREHLQGRDIRKDLRREMVEHEIDFERDPILRDRVRSKLAASEGGGLGEVLAKAGITTDEIDPAFEKRAQQEEARQATDARKRQRARLAADSAMVTAIVALTAAVAFLVFGR